MYRIYKTEHIETLTKSLLANLKPQTSKMHRQLTHASLANAHSLRIFNIHSSTQLDIQLPKDRTLYNTYT